MKMVSAIIHRRCTKSRAPHAKLENYGAVSELTCGGGAPYGDVPAVYSSTIYMHCLASPRPLWHAKPADVCAGTAPDIQFDLAPAAAEPHTWELQPWSTIGNLVGANWQLSLAASPPGYEAVLRLYTRRQDDEMIVLFGQNAARIVVRWRSCEEECEQFQRELSSWLLGTVLGYAMSLRGLPTLHGSVVEIDGRAVALLGASGAGKSTLAGALVARGHAMLADDHLVAKRMDMQPEHGGWYALPGPPRLRLWPASMAVCDGPAKPVSTWTDDDGKLHVEPAEAAYCPNPQPLAAIYVLLPRELGRREAAIEELAPAAALHALMQQRFGTVGYEPTYTAASLAALAELAQQTPVRLLHRPEGLETLASVVAAVQGNLERDGK